MMKIFFVTLLVSSALGWGFIFLMEYKKKGSVRWAWLLAQPWPLSEKKSRELRAFYAR